MHAKKKAQSYIIGAALGDGNLSNPNGRAVRLRITCDSKYPILAQDIIKNLKLIFPNNKVSIVRPRVGNFFNISLYSNTLVDLMPWKPGKGSKFFQKARVPKWIRANELYSKLCLRGLIQTDGCIYKDRGYLMVNFTNHIEPLAQDVFEMLSELGFRPTYSTTQVKSGTKYTVRVARDAEVLIKRLGLYKA